MGKNVTKKERKEIVAKKRHKHELRKQRKNDSNGWTYRMGYDTFWKSNILAMFRKPKPKKVA